MDEFEALRALADELGVLTHYVDGLHRPVQVGPETLVRVCAALGADVSKAEQAEDALRSLRAARRESLPPVLVAWDGHLAPVTASAQAPTGAEVHLEAGGVVPLDVVDGRIQAADRLPSGYHRLVVATRDGPETCTVIAAPTETWRRPGSASRSWGVGAHLAALRSARSRALGDLRDLETLCRWTRERGGDLVTVLPLLPTFNQASAEPSPYAPVSRLFWSELILDLEEDHVPAPTPTLLDVTRGDAEVRAALARRGPPHAAALDPELIRYAQFRGAQARLGRDWRSWPEAPRSGRLVPRDIDPVEEQYHLKAQVLVRHQLDEVLQRLAAQGVRLGLDLSVGVHPDGFDPWARQALFARGMSVGAPPDPGFPSGQDWGFAPVLPVASRQEGHRYLAACIAHQAARAGVLRIDHVMALTRLYWIPHGFGLHEGTYVKYPTEELFAVLTLESHRHRCEIVGENLGTVPAETHEALVRHNFQGLFLAEFEAMSGTPQPPAATQVAMIGSHDTPTLAGWVDGIDIDERVRCGLLAEDAVMGERAARRAAAERLASLLGERLEELPAVLAALLDWLGRSPSPLVIIWLEDFWLERDQVNLPGTRSSDRPNWQRPLSRLLDDALTDAAVDALARRLQNAREDGKGTDG